MELICRDVKMKKKEHCEVLKTFEKIEEEDSEKIKDKEEKRKSK